MKTSLFLFALLFVSMLTGRGYAQEAPAETYEFRRPVVMLDGKEILDPDFGKGKNPHQLTLKNLKPGSEVKLRYMNPVQEKIKVVSLVPESGELSQSLNLHPKLYLKMKYRNMENKRQKTEIRR
ncbi:MAG: hypothetical protein LW884_06875 [Bacteroidetes bacterium]|jgi:hypothetical protein|nr:hypothetical protein [Bacteroidota bacterium]